MLILLAFPKGGMAQSEVEELKQVFQAIQKEKPQYLQLTYRWFESHTSTQSVDEVAGEWYQNEHLTYSKMAHLISIMEGPYLLTVDQENQLIQLATAPESVSQTPLMLAGNLDSVLSAYEWIQVDRSNPKMHQYQLGLAQGMYEQADLFIEPNTKEVKKLVLYFAQPPWNTTKLATATPRVEITFESLPMPARVQQEFHTQHYLTGKMDQAQLRPAFQTYQFYNHIQP
ncbi:MAG: hypothetical protein AAF399_07045 [Bacteroidota bacterium]